MAGGRFLFLLSSGRKDGNSEALAREAAKALPSGVAQEWLDLGMAHLSPFEDLRHSTGYGPLAGQVADLAKTTLAATDIVFVAPLYWYGLPGLAKLYLDHWSHWMRAPGLEFREKMASKTLWLVMAHSGSEPEQIAPAVDSLRWTADYMKMRWGGALLVNANAPGTIAQDADALDQARRFFLA